MLSSCEITSKTISCARKRIALTHILPDALGLRRPLRPTLVPTAQLSSFIMKDTILPTWSTSVKYFDKPAPRYADSPSDCPFASHTPSGSKTTEEVVLADVVRAAELSLIDFDSQGHGHDVSENKVVKKVEGMAQWLGRIKRVENVEDIAIGKTASERANVLSRGDQPEPGVTVRLDDIAPMSSPLDHLNAAVQARNGKGVTRLALRMREDVVTEAGTSQSAKTLLSLAENTDMGYYLVPAVKDDES